MGPDDTYRRDAPTWGAFAALFAFGLLNALLGPALPYLREALQLSYVEGALHQAAFAVGGMTAGVLATRTSAPRRPTIVVGLVGGALAALGIGYGGTLAVTLVASLLVSLLATAALIRMWALLADLHHRHRAVAMTEGEVAVSLAGILTPGLVAACAASVLGWGFATVVVLALVAVAAVGVLRTAPVGPGEEPVPGAAAAPGHGHVRRTLATVFAIVGLEFALSFWAATYLHDDVGLGRETAVVLVSTLYAAQLVGRLVTSRVARRLAARPLLLLCLGTTLVGLPFLLAADGIVLATLGLVVAGAGIGGTFPLASALHVEASHRSADQALGQTLTVAGVGQVLAPLAAGAVAQVADLRTGLLVLPALVLLAAAATGLPGRREA